MPASCCPATSRPDPPSPPAAAPAACCGTAAACWAGLGPQLVHLLAELSRGAAYRVADPSCCLAGELADSLADAAERLSGAGRGLCSPGSRGSRGSGRASQRAVEDVELLEPYLQLRLGFNARNVDLDVAETDVDSRHDLEPVRRLGAQREVCSRCSTST